MMSMNCVIHLCLMVFATQLAGTVQDHPQEKEFDYFKIRVRHPEFVTNTWLIPNARDWPNQIAYMKNITAEAPLTFNYTIEDFPYIFQNWRPLDHGSFSLCDASSYYGQYDIRYHVRHFLGIGACPIAQGTVVYPHMSNEEPETVGLYRPLGYDLRPKRFLVTIYTPDKQVIFTGKFYFEQALHMYSRG